MSSAARKPAPRLPRPAARYWKGKAPKGADAASDSDDDEEVEEQQEAQDDGDVLIRDLGEGEEDEDEDLPMRTETVVKPAKSAISVALKDVNISREGKVIVGGKEESGRTAAELEEGTFPVSLCSYENGGGGSSPTEGTVVPCGISETKCMHQQSQTIKS